MPGSLPEAQLLSAGPLVCVVSAKFRMASNRIASRFALRVGPALRTMGRYFSSVPGTTELFDGYYQVPTLGAKSFFFVYSQASINKLFFFLVVKLV